MKKLFAAIAVVGLLVLGATPAAAGQKTPQAPQTTCADIGKAIAQIPYQIPGPRVEIDGRGGCNGGDFYRLKVRVAVWVYGYVPAVGGWTEDDFNLHICPAGTSPCYGNFSIVKKYTDWAYFTIVDFWYQPYVGGPWIIVDGDASNSWEGIR